MKRNFLENLFKDLEVEDSVKKNVIDSIMTENGNDVNHANNTGVVIDDIYPAWYAKRNNLKNRNKYINQDVYLLLDFIGKY